MTGDGASPNVKKDRRRFGLHKKKSSGGSWGGVLGRGAELTLPNQSGPSKPDAHDTSLPSVSVSIVASKLLNKTKLVIL